MTKLSLQDQAVGLVATEIGNHRVAAYRPDLMLRIVEKLAEGELLQDIAKTPGYPTRLTIMQWVMTHPEAARAFAAARELSAQALEERALSMGSQIVGLGSGATGTQVRAFEVAMNQLRWSASRRDPKKFGDQRQTAIVVPVTINTTLPMGTSGVGAGTEDHPNIYQLQAKVQGQDPTPTDVEEVIASDPDKPFTEPHHLGGPKKLHLTPASQGVPDTEQTERERVRLEQRLAANKRNRERLAALKQEMRDRGTLPGDRSYREIKQWLADHPAPSQPLAEPAAEE